jgi:hypothetical protein
MNRREVLGGLGGLAAAGLSGKVSYAAVTNEQGKAGWPFRGPITLNQWTHILADGFPCSCLCIRRRCA